MPILQQMATRFNGVFGEPGRLDDELFASGERSLADRFTEAGVVTTDDEAAYWEAVPSGMQEALRAMLHHNRLREVSLPVTIAWAPGYDYELTFWEAPGTPVSPGGITILLGSRYPLDSHPSEQKG